MSVISKIRVFLGIIPKTDVLEKKWADLNDEFKRYNEFSKSKELTHFEELKSFVTSADFQKKKQEIMSLKYNNTEEYRKEQEFSNLKKSARFKIYFKVKDSAELSEYKQTDSSKELKDYIQLDKYIHSSEFINVVSSTPKKEFKNTEEFQKQLQHKELKSLASIKKYYKFKQTDKLRIYEELEGSNELKDYIKAETFINSEEFKKVKDYMLLSPKKKWEISDEFAKLQEYNSLNKSAQIIWYKSLENTKKFDEIKHWSIAFEDDFQAKKLDAKKWLTKYFYGDAIVNDTYTICHDKHFVTDGKNLEISDGALKIITRKEQASGKAWHPKYGFHPKNYDFTSGIINTGGNYRQKLGKIEAKVRVSDGATHTLWMVGEKALPQLNLFKWEKNWLSLGLFDGELKKNGVKKQSVSFPGGKYTKDYHIFSIEWNEQSITWKINGLEVKTINNNLPQSAMYINFSSGLYNKVDEAKLPSTLEVDWIRCWEKN